MTKYQKHPLPAKRKRRVLDVVHPTITDGQSYVDVLALADVQAGLQRALEAERDEIVGRSWHDDHAAGAPLQYRNDYGKPRALTCGCGRVKVEMPRLREPYASQIVQKYERLTPAVRDLIPQLYLHGLATGDFQQAFGWLWGEDVPLSSANIVHLKASWEEDYRRWKEQRLQEEYLYVWADGIYPKAGPA